VIEGFNKEAAMKFRATLSVMAVCGVLALNARAQEPQAQKSAASNPTGGTSATPSGRNDQAANSQYRLGAEDVISFFVHKEPELTSTVVVRPDGMITVPMAGLIHAAGKTTTELEAEITSKLLKFFLAEPVVNISVTEVNSPKISVFGQVNKPDVFPIRQKMTLLNAIALAGGFTEFAKRDRVFVIRETSSGQETIKLNLKNLSKDQSPFYLRATDTVFVE
jgi:polysaccharide export outer membrane protein